MVAHIMQNFLAQNSSGEMMYVCGKCYTEVSKDADVCPKCGSKLGKIKCPFCQFTGGVNDFKNDTCPKCGRKNLNEAPSSNKSSLKPSINKKEAKETKNGENHSYIHVDPLRNKFLLFFLPLLSLVLFLIFVFLKYFEII